MYQKILETYKKSIRQMEEYRHTSKVGIVELKVWADVITYSVIVRETGERIDEEWERKDLDEELAVFNA